MNFLIRTLWVAFLSVFFLINSSGVYAQEAKPKGSIGPFNFERSGAAAFMPDISAIGTFTAAAFRDDPGENGPNPSRTGLNLQEIELAIQSVIDPYIRADIYIGFHEDEVELEEGYITTLSLPAGFQIRAGKLLLPFGRQNQKHLEAWNFVNDPLVSNKIFGGEGFNELAFVPSILFKLPFFLQLEGAFSQGDNENNFDGSSKANFAYTGRLSTSFELSPNTTALVGTSATFGTNDTGPSNRTQIYGGDLLFKWKPTTTQGLSWQTEFIYRHREVPLANEKEGGLYTEVVGQFAKRWQAGARFDYLGLPRVDEKHWRISPMLRFMPSEFLSVRAQYDYDDSDITRPNHAGFLQTTFIMGPHGSHKF